MKHYYVFCFDIIVDIFIKKKEIDMSCVLKLQNNLESCSLKLLWIFMLTFFWSGCYLYLKDEYDGGYLYQKEEYDKKWLCQARGVAIWSLGVSHLSV